MSSVYAILARSDRPVDGMSPSAEDVAIHAMNRGDDDDPDGYRAAIEFVGGCVDRTEEGYCEIVLSRRAAKRLPAWSARTVYLRFGDVPQAFHDDVADLAELMARKAQRPVPRCRSCAEPATEVFFGRAVLCARCRDMLPDESAYELPEPGPRVICACRRCGVDVHFGLDVVQQVREVGRFTWLCKPCYLSRAVAIDLDGTVNPSDL